MDYVAILNVGVIGLGFLLAVLAYRLISNPNVSSGAAANVRLFLAFSLLICALGLGSEYLRNRAQGVEASLSAKVADLEGKNEKLEADLVAEKSKPALSEDQAKQVADALAKSQEAIDLVSKIPPTVSGSCSGGPHGIDPDNFGTVAGLANDAGSRLVHVNGTLRMVSNLP